MKYAAEVTVKKDRILRGITLVLFLASLALALHLVDAPDLRHNLPFMLTLVCVTGATSMLYAVRGHAVRALLMMVSLVAFMFITHH